MSVSSVGHSTMAHNATSKSSNNSGGDFQSLIDATNAPILEKRQQNEKQAALMMRRILEVGFDTYVAEQKQVQKLMKVLTLRRMRLLIKTESHHRAVQTLPAVYCRC